MSLPCPQRDALESVERKSTSWSSTETKKLTEQTTFRLASGETIHFLGVSEGASMRDDPNLHIAVFALTPRTDATQNARRLPECRFGGLITGPDNEGWFWAEGLAFEDAKNGVAILCKTGRRSQYRPV